jgi:hypothetical protein
VKSAIFAVLAILLACGGFTATFVGGATFDARLTLVGICALLAAAGAGYIAAGEDDPL